jgi:hypothetical protein
MQRASDFRTQNPGLLTAWANQMFPNNQQPDNGIAGMLQERGQANQTIDYLLRNKLVDNEADARAVAGNDKLLSAILQQHGLAGDGVTYSKTPVWGTDAEGNTGIGTIGDDGTFQILDTGDFKPQRPIEKYETDTEIVTYNSMTGEILSRMPKDTAEAKRLGVLGEELGKLQTVLSEMQGSMPELQHVASTLSDLAERATFGAVQMGWDEAHRIFGQNPGAAANARAAYITMVRDTVLPLLKQTFGTQFTDAEGQRLEGTLGDVNLSPQEKQAALQVWIESKVANLQTRKRTIEELQKSIGPRDAAGSGGDEGGGDEGGPRPRKQVGGKWYEMDADGNWYPEN